MVVWLLAYGFSGYAYLPVSWTPRNPDHGGWNLSAQTPPEFFSAGRLVYHVVAEGPHAIDHPDRVADLINAFQTWEDVPTSRLAFSRGEDYSAQQAVQRVGMTYAFSDGDNKTHWGQDMSGASGVALWTSFASYYGGPEQMYNADVCFSRQWAVSDRFEATALHEIGHALGLSHSPEAHSTLSYVGPVRAGVPGELARLATGDKLGLSMMYPVAGFRAARGAIGGSIQTSAGTPVHQAQIGVFDAAGILQLVTLSDDGRYLAQGLLPGAYTLKLYPSQTSPEPILHHPARALPWRQMPPTPFMALEGVGTTVAAGVTATLNVTVPAGNPTMTTAHARYSFGYRSHVLLLAPGESQRVGVSGYGFPNSLAELAAFNYSGSGIALSSPQVGNGLTTFQTVIAADAVPGTRGLTVRKNTGEKNIVLGFLEISPIGGATVANGPHNPASSALAPGMEHVVQQIRITAQPTEQVRVRTWHLAPTGTGDMAQVAGVSLYRDLDGDGVLGMQDPRLATAPPGSPTVLRTHHTIPPGESHDFLVVYAFANPQPGESFGSTLTALRANGVDSFVTFSLPSAPVAGALHAVGAPGDVHVVSFQAAAGGSVQGAAVQVVEPGQSTTPVQAIPDEGFAFVGWSGGLTSPDNPLVVHDIRQSMTVTAQFFGSPPPAFAYRESFETGLGQWLQVDGDDGDWTRWSGPTPTPGTGPAAASDGDWYAYVHAGEELQPGPNEVVVLLLSVDLDAMAEPEITFDYHMYGPDVGALEVQILLGFPQWELLWRAEGGQGDAWRSRTVDLSAYAGQVSLQFVAFTGDGPLGDIALDTIIVRDAAEEEAPPLPVEAFSVFPAIPIAPGYTHRRQVQIDIQLPVASEATHWAIGESLVPPPTDALERWQPLGPGVYDITGEPGTVTLYLWLRNLGAGGVPALPSASDEIVLAFETRFEFDLAGAQLDKLAFGHWLGATDGDDLNLDAVAPPAVEPTGGRAYFQAGAPDAPVELAADFRAPLDPSWWRVLIHPGEESTTLAWQAQTVPVGWQLVLHEMVDEIAVGEPRDLAVAGAIHVATPTVFRLTLGRPKNWSLPLSPGWNLLGQPVVKSNDGLRGEFPEMWLWDGEAYQSGGGGPPAEKAGFWVAADDAAGEIRFEGLPVDGAIRLQAGWNLVAVGVDATCPHEVPLAWKWNAENGVFHPVRPGEDVTAGRGYWIWRPTAETIVFSRRR